MISRISDKVLAMKRDLGILIKKPPVKEHFTNDTIQVTSTYGSDDHLTNSVKKVTSPE